MKNPLVSGLLLIAGAVAGVLVMLGHPTAHDLITAADPGRRAAGNMAVHSVALATLPMLFLGLSGLTRRLDGGDLSLAALVLYGFGAFATVPAAVMSGFVATDLILDMEGAGAASRDLSFALLRYTALVNRGFYACAVVAVSLATLLWSAAILRGRRLSRGAGIAGVVVGTAIPLGLLSGHVGLGIHDVAMMTGAQSIWYVWIESCWCGLHAARCPARAAERRRVRGSHRRFSGEPSQNPVHLRQVVGSGRALCLLEAVC